ncbi:hypothetical protein AGABI1DRAFT_126575 [Agaricus bisporus var. burnettii JB137-S8]|uniref:Uncharacterized protein n=1 Tax=Agaricus bisporus var. burnettii (strain JB137-S8 / ATCC MYA-4627 / FGSC 10392) TaxID=597362 RepID=K5W5Z0_AGABU|nr:uncharacterized protein AGABI1DRAFT_126575 [Agaricus bisporus var. burnettii JB137-S8]EKM82244.1 hypothetical protein AGABI1DRAFT_126575 [Agaricus bisporus var. burnettii JB137-S8]
MYAFKLAATVFAFFAIQASAASTPVPCGDNYCTPYQQCCKSINGPICATLPDGAVC